MVTQQHKAKKRSVLRTAFYGALWAGFFVAVGVGGLIAWYARDLPNLSQGFGFERRPLITLLAADGSLIGRYGDFRGETVDVRTLPPYLVNAVLAIEDHRFYSHFGIDVIGLSRAIYRNLRAGHLVQGGSTITQQLAKNVFLSSDRTLRRKIQEALLAIQLERTYTKDQILTAYMNRVYLGAGTYGFDAAAQTYFGKSAKDVNLREAAILAALLKAPSRYAPSTNPDKADERAALVIQAMLDHGFLTQADLTALQSATPAPKRKPLIGSDAHYFADWVADQVSAFAGYEVTDLTVVTTLDPALQRAAETHVDTLVQEASEKSRVSQAALVSMTPDGAIKAMVGGVTYQASQFNRATQALRQPGSSFKPIVYLTALEQGHEPDEIIEDAPIKIGKWNPSNFNNEYRGMIPLRDALAYSANTVAVRLVENVGVNRVRSMARRLGVTAPLGKDLSLALGTSEVTLLEMMGVYGTLANLGNGVQPYAIVSIKDSQGNVLYEHPAPTPVQVVDPQTVAKLQSMMMGTIAYGTGQGAKLDRPAAAKTGTSQDSRDAWFMGFTADFITGVWVGNDDNSPMRRVTGGGLPAKIWKATMNAAHGNLPPRPLSGLDMNGHVAALPVMGDEAAPDSPLSLMPVAVDAPTVLEAPVSPQETTPAPETAPLSAPAAPDAAGSDLDSMLNRVLR